MEEFFSSLNLYWKRGNRSGLAFRNLVVVAVMDFWVWEQHERVYKSWLTLEKIAKGSQGFITAERLSESARRSTEQMFARRGGPKRRPGSFKGATLKLCDKSFLVVRINEILKLDPSLNSFLVLVPIPQLRMTTFASYLLHLSLTAPSYMLHLSDVIQHWPSFCRHRHTISSFCVFCRQYCVVRTYIHI